MTFTEITTEARRFSKSSSSSYPIAEVTASANKALNRVTALIREAQARWQWDDASNSDFPFATTALVDGQQDYSLDPTHYRIERVEVMDQDNNWTKLFPIDQADIYNQAITDFESQGGVPLYYDKVGNSILLYPQPNYSQAASLKVFYERGPDYFTTSDTTKEPGFNPLFHSLISLWSAYDYAFINQLPISNLLRSEIAIMEGDMKDYYTLRDEDDRIQLRPRHRSYR